jgi:hypothetical protein
LSKCDEVFDPLDFHTYGPPSETRNTVCTKLQSYAGTVAPRYVLDRA